MSSTEEMGLQVYELMKNRLQVINIVRQINRKKFRMMNHGKQIIYLNFISEQRADLGIGDISVTSERFEAIDYTNVHYINSVTFTTALPESTGYSSSLFGPFDIIIWFLIFSFILLIFSINFISKNKNYNDLNLCLNWSFISIILNQPIILKRLKLLSIRILFIDLIFFCFVLQNFYCGQLFTLMTLSYNSHTIETIEELVLALKSRKLIILTYEGALFLSKIKVNYSK